MITNSSTSPSEGLKAWWMSPLSLIICTPLCGDRFGLPIRPGLGVQTRNGLAGCGLLLCPGHGKRTVPMLESRVRHLALLLLQRGSSSFICNSSILNGAGLTPLIPNLCQTARETNYDTTHSARSGLQYLEGKF